MTATPGRGHSDVHRSRALRCLATVFTIGLAYSGHALSTERPDGIGECAADIGNIGSCTANDIAIANALAAVVEEEDFCFAGASVKVASILVGYDLNAAQRYDPLLWVGLDGNDPREEGTGGSCYVSALPELEGVFADLDGDSCLDVPNTGYQSIDYGLQTVPGGVEVLCEDNDADGMADVRVIVSWQQNTNQQCGDGTIEGESFGLGAPSKCNYSLVPLDIEYVTATLTVAKAIASNHGGTATLADFDVSVNGAEIPWSDASSTTGGSELAADEAGTYTLSEADVAGYTEGIWSCVDADQNEVPVTNDGHFSGADVTVAEGQEVTCSITNTDDAPSLTLLKSVTNDDGGLAQPADFILRLDGDIYTNAPFSSGDSPPVLANTAYTLSEDAVDGYLATGVSCFDEGAEEFVPHPVTLSPGQVVSCTIGNDDIAPQLTLVKSVVNDNGGEAGPGDFTLRLDGGIYINESFGSGDSPPVEANEAYTLSEDSPEPDYVFTGVTCFDEGAEAGVPHPVTLALGQVVTCTLTNNDVPPPGVPMLTLVKSVINDNGGAALPGDFTLRLDGGVYENSPFTSGDSPPVAADTAYTLSEDELSGYASLGVSCFDVLAEEVVPHPVTLVADQVVTCTIANDDIPVDLRIIKHVVNDDGGDAVAGDWTMDIVASNPSDNHFPGEEAPGILINIDAGPYSVDESGGPGGYQKSLGAGCAGDLGVGQSATCILTNDDIQPSLTVTKIILFNDEGPATLGDFDIRVDDVPVLWDNPASKSGGSELVAGYATTYTLSEAPLEGYVEGAWSCSDADGEVPVTNGGLFSGADVTVLPGQDVTCGITNVYGPVEQSLTVQKIIVSDDGGTAVLSDFHVSVGDVEVAWANPASTTGGIQLVEIGAGTYTLSEDPAEHYDPGQWECSDEDGPVPVTNDGFYGGADVTVAPGQHVTCSITNDDVPGPVTEQSLTVTKIIVSDQGGTASVEDFDVSVDGVEVDWLFPDSTTGDTRRVVDLPGTYRLSESEVGGYVPGAWTCSDDDGPVSVSNEGYFGGANVTVGIGRHVHCSITNNDVYEPVPGLVVVKNIRSDHGGTASVGDFGISVNGNAVPWDDPDSTTGGSRFVSGKPGTYTLSEAEVDGYLEGRWSCQDAKSNSVPVTNDGHFSGADVVVAPKEQVTCTITNADEKPKADLRVRKSVDPAIDECGVLVGQQLDFSIEVSNAGPGPAEGVILEDHWSWQLKPTLTPDMYECDDPNKERWIRCKLGNLEPGAGMDVGFGFMVGGNPGEEACNLARASAYPADNGNPEDNESKVCFKLVGELSLAPGCGELAPAIAGMDYEEFVEIVGGRPPYDVDEIDGLPRGFTGTVTDSAVRIAGCSAIPGASEFTVVVSDRLGCQDTSAAPASCRLEVIKDPDCSLGDLHPLEKIPPAGSPTSDADVLPDESVQKIVVDGQRNRYLVGYAYREHDYQSDPNGPYVHHPRNYDIRVVKYDDTGALQWDQTYDTGSDDYGFAIALDTSGDRPWLFVGGGAEVESGPHAWHEAVLVQIDPDTGCPAGRHFQSAGPGTTSAYYDIATDGVKLYAVGERQRNEILIGDFGALIGIYKHDGFAASPVACEGDHHLIGYPPVGGDPALEDTLVRAGGLDPTVAYAVKLPDSGCVDCPVLVGGRSESGGWVDEIVADDGDQALFLATTLGPAVLGDISVQDLAIPEDRVIVVGSSSANDMRVLAFDRAGNAVWAPKTLGEGRLRGVAVDASGAVYVVGRSNDAASAGLLFKFDAAGRELDRAEYTEGFGVSFTDLAIFDPGSGVMAAQAEESAFDYRWLQVEFDCDRSVCPPDGD